MNGKAKILLLVEAVVKIGLDKVKVKESSERRFQ